MNKKNEDLMSQGFMSGLIKELRDEVNGLTFENLEKNLEGVQDAVRLLTKGYHYSKKSSASVMFKEVKTTPEPTINGVDVAPIDEEPAETKETTLSPQTSDLQLNYPVPDTGLEKDEVNKADNATVIIAPLERILKGAYLGEERIFIPEKVVREKGFEHGDVIEATLINTASNPPVCEFKLRTKGTEDVRKSASRVGIENQKIWKDEAGDWAVEVNHPALNINGKPHTYRLSKTAVKNFPKIKSGDNVALAYYKSSPLETLRVVWQYPTQNVAK